MEKLVVHVTQDDINKGVEGNSHLCPIARAVRRLGKKRVTVDGAQIQVRSRWYEMPYKAEKFVDRFDMGKRVKPFTFTAVQPDLWGD